MISKLRRKFIVIAMSSVTLVIVLLSLSVNVINFISVNSDINDMLELICENQGAVPEPPRVGRPDVSTGALITPETPYSTRYFVLYYGSDGSLHNADMRHIAAVTESDADDYLHIALEHGVGSAYSGSYKFRVVSAAGGNFMAVFLECAQELRSVRIFALASVMVVAVCVALVYILVFLLSKRAIDPVVKSAERQKQFITDAGHELKTPLTVITTCLKVLEMEVGEQKWIHKAQAQTEKMSELVGELVTLSRLDEEEPALKIADFCISEAVADTAESFRDFAAARGLTLETEIPAGISYRGDEYAVRRLVSILLDNAVKYSTGGSIRLSLHQARRGVVLKALNACGELDPSELNRLFDRFYRVDTARFGEAGGFGVGLSIARSIAEAHRGSVRAECPSPGMIRFTVSLR